MNSRQKTIFDEHNLISFFNEGNELAFNQVFKKFYGGLCFFTAKITSNSDASEDIVQDIFVKLWHKHADFDTTNAIKAFLYISCRNAGLNYLAQQQRRNLQHTELSYLSDEVENSVLNEIIYVEALREINTQLDHLPEQCARVIKMLFQEGLKPQEVANELGITVSTVYNQKLRGISILRTRLSLTNLSVLLLLLDNVNN